MDIMGIAHDSKYFFIESYIVCLVGFAEVQTLRMDS